MHTLQDYQKLLHKFITLYIYNLNTEHVSQHNNTNKQQTKKNNNAFKLKPDIIDFFYNKLDFMGLIYNINMGEPILTYKELFKILTQQIIDFNTIYKPIPRNQKHITLIDMHGSFNFDNGFQTVPNNFVLVFLTPVNRYGYGLYCDKTHPDYLATLESVYTDPKIRNNIFDNLSCLDKYSDRNNKNTSYNLKLSLQDAVVLFPGQKYFDLNLSFEERDVSDFMNIYNFPDIDGNIIMQTELNVSSYSDTLSSILTTRYSKAQQHTLNYVFIRCCRNLDEEVSSLNTNTNISQTIYTGYSIYVYENFMYYFNTIMNICDTDIKSNLLEEAFGNTAFNNKGRLLLRNNSVKFDNIRQQISTIFCKYINLVDEQCHTLFIEQIRKQFNTQFLKSLYDNKSIDYSILDIISNILNNIHMQNEYLNTNQTSDTKLLTDELMDDITQTEIYIKLMHYIHKEVPSYLLMIKDNKNNNTNAKLVRKNLGKFIEFIANSKNELLIAAIDKIRYGSSNRNRNLEQNLLDLIALNYNLFFKHNIILKIYIQIRKLLLLYYKKHTNKNTKIHMTKQLANIKAQRHLALGRSGRLTLRGLLRSKLNNNNINKLSLNFNTPLLNIETYLY